MSSFENNRVPIEKLYNSISKWISQERCFAFFDLIFDEFDKNWKKDLRANHWKSSLARKLLQVHERLMLTDQLMNDLHDESESIKWYMYPSLVTYLRLTCFDQLGQPAKWMTFDNWLKSKKTAVERQSAIENTEIGNNLIYAERLYSYYQKQYGVKNSFYRFIRQILPQDKREQLFSKIQIKIDDDFTDNMYARYNIRESTSNDKESYLYNIRNDYTHNTYGLGPILGFEPNKADPEWRFREKVFVGNETHRVSTSLDFEDYLKEVVLNGIVSIINKGN